MTFVVDTSMWVPELEAHVGATIDRSLIRNEYAYATDVVCAELLAAPHRERQSTLVEELRDGRRILGLEGLDDMWLAADCMRATRRAGRTVRSMADCLIAAVCIREGLPLLHNDRDFDTLAALTPLQVVRL